MRLETEHPNKVKHEVSGLQLRWDVLGPVLFFFVFALVLAAVDAASVGELPDLPPNPAWAREDA